MPTEQEQRRIVEAALPELRLFPLPATVLLPVGHVPLHVFEPRYRQLLDDCLKHDRVVALALLQPGWEESYYERPPIRSVVGAGYIQAEQILDDGRANILLHGILRAQIVEECAGDGPYRLVHAEPLADIYDADADHLDQAAQTLRQLLVNLAGGVQKAASASQGEAAAALAQASLAESDPARLSDLVAAALLGDATERQAHLEEQRVLKRLECATETVVKLLARVSRRVGQYYSM